MSTKGIQYVETKLDINPTLSNKEKVEKVCKIFTKQGFSILTEFAAKVVAEITKG